MYQKIMVPIDESCSSMYALKEACKLAKTCGASLHIIHINEFAQFSWSDATHNGVVCNENTDKILESANKLINEYQITAQTAILHNSGEKIANIIVREAQKQNCDLIIMGTHGLTGFMHLLMGSVAEGVLRNSSIPVMLIRKTEN